MTAENSVAENRVLIPPATGKRLAVRWQARAVAVVVTFWLAAVIVPQALGLSGPWRAFGAGLVVPGSGLLYSIPAMNHSMGPAMVIGHAVLLVCEIGAVAWALRRLGWPVTMGTLLALAVLAAGYVVAPYAVVVAGHVGAFIGVLVACGWAIGLRLIARADSVTLVAIVLISAGVGAGLTALHGAHPGSFTWMPWSALGLVLLVGCMMTVRAVIGRRAAERRGAERSAYLDKQRLNQTSQFGTSLVALDRSTTAPTVTEANGDQLKLLRYLLGVANAPVDNWDNFDDEAKGPLQQYRYQVNALGWALATFNYSHTPAYAGVLAEAQVALIQRAQQKAVWSYWYWQNLLGNWDFIKRRADPIDLPQNIMFSGYLNLQMAMFRQATGDARFDRDESLVFDWSPRQRFSFNHQQLNAILIRNFNQDLCLWPCEPVLSRGRRRGFVFPYCNTVTAAGIAIMDTIDGTDYGAKIVHNIEFMLAREFTQATNDLAAFMVSGLGLSVRQLMSGTGSTAGVVAFIAPLRPELAWRAWEILKREWLETGEFREAGSTGQEMPDWSTGAKTNAETLAAAMHLAHTVGDEYWHAELWDAAATELRFSGNGESEGVAKFEAASVHANGMLGMGGMTRPYAFNDMLIKPRPPEWQHGPRLIDAPHPNVLVSKAVSDGHGLDLVLRPGITNQRVGLRLDQLQPGRDYIAHGAVDSLVSADAAGAAQVAVDIEDRTEVLIRPA